MDMNSTPDPELENSINQVFDTLNESSKRIPSFEIRSRVLATIQSSCQLKTDYFDVYAASTAIVAASVVVVLSWQSWQVFEPWSVYFYWAHEQWTISIPKNPLRQIRPPQRQVEFSMRGHQRPGSVSFRLFWFSFLDWLLGLFQLPNGYLRKWSRTATTPTYLPTTLVLDSKSDCV